VKVSINDFKPLRQARQEAVLQALLAQEFLFLIAEVSNLYCCANPAIFVSCDLRIASKVPGPRANKSEVLIEM
jgi:hypothetical protein